MAKGRLTEKNVPVVPIQVAGRTLEAVVDTGFESGLQLPDELIPDIDPPPTYFAPVQLMLGTGQETQTHLFMVSVLVDGLPLTVETIFCDAKDVIVGLHVLKHFRLTIDFPAGTVELTR